jgi:hypothetical protein
MQLYFTITEFLVALCFLTLCDASTPVSPGTVWVMIAIAGGHALRTPIDQFHMGATAS